MSFDYSTRMPQTTPTTPASGVATPAAAAQGRPGENVVIPPGGLSAATGAGAVGYSSASMAGVDWDALAMETMGLANASVNIQALMVELIAIFASMRKEQRTFALEEAQTALAFRMEAADHQEKAAMIKMWTGVAQGLMTMAQGAAQYKAGSLQAKYGTATDPGYQSKQMSAAGTGMQGLSTIGSAVGNYMSELEGAEATRDQANASYADTRAQSENDFAQMWKDAIAKFIQTMGNVEAAQHSASEKIYQG